MVQPNVNNPESRSSESLFVWDPDTNQRFIRIEDPPFDREGNPLDLARGIRYDDQLEVGFLITQKAFVPDMPYDIGRFLIIRASVFAHLEPLDLSGVQVISGALITEDGSLVEEIKWLNVLVRASVMDQTESMFRMVDGLLREVSYYSVDPSNVPSVDMFRCADTLQIIVTRKAVNVIESNGLQGAVFSPLEGSQWP